MRTITFPVASPTRSAFLSFSNVSPRMIGGGNSSNPFAILGWSVAVDSQPSQPGEIKIAVVRHSSASGYTTISSQYAYDSDDPADTNLLSQVDPGAAFGFTSLTGPEILELYEVPVWDGWVMQRRYRPGTLISSDSSYVGIAYDIGNSSSNVRMSVDYHEL